MGEALISSVNPQFEKNSASGQAGEFNQAFQRIAV